MKRFLREIHPAVWAMSAALFFFHLLVSAVTEYGIFRDELYYIACAKRLAWGYVDQPPLSIALLALNRLILGDSLVALRFLPSLVMSVVVVMAALLAKRLGGGRRAQMLAALGVVASPLYIGSGNYFSMNVFDIFFWAALFLLVLDLLQTGNRRRWLTVGIVAGLGMMNKYSVGFMLFGLVVGLLVTPARRLLASRWLAAGAAAGAIIFLPHVLWEVQTGWPTLEFIRHAQMYKIAEMNVWQFFTAQLIEMNPLSLLLWGPGLIWLLVLPSGRPYRAFGVMYVAVFLIFILQKAKAYYLGPAYPILFAAGGVALEQIASYARWRWAPAVAAAAITLATVIILPFSVPLLPVERFVAYSRWIGIQPPQEERHRFGVLPQHFADRFGWKEMADTIGSVYQKLTPHERSVCAVFVDNYGEAGALEFYGARSGITRVLSGHNNYWLWGPGDATGEVIIVLGGDLESTQREFERVDVAGEVTCAYCMPYESNLTIYVCRGLKRPLKELWPRLKAFG